MKGRRSSHVGISLVVLWFSTAQVCFKPSNWRRLLTQAFIAGVVLARIKAGSRAAPTTTKDTIRAITLAFLVMLRHAERTRSPTAAGEDR
jgi:hypothetical protein